MMLKAAALWLLLLVPTAVFAQQPSFPTDPASPLVRVRLTHFQEPHALFRSDSSLQLLGEDGRVLATIPPRQIVRFDQSADRSHLAVTAQTRRWSLQSATLHTDEIIEIVNYDHPSRYGTYDHFRRTIHVYPSRTSPLLVNELPLEEYLWGIAESLPAEPDAKKHAITVLARSFALVYSQCRTQAQARRYGIQFSTCRRKYATDRYDFTDRPENDQHYLGFDWERAHPGNRAMVRHTRGLVITHPSRGGGPVIGPYFSSSDGRSRDKLTTRYPWARVRELPLDKGRDLTSHGTGLSAHSARRLAAEYGYTYRQILDYFYDGITIKRAY